MTGLVIDENFRGQGFGPVLFNAAESWVRESSFLSLNHLVQGLSNTGID
ncbi:MAG: GNAT family N-acetyltransferase [Spirochaetales bacterium]|nr:GNAT family N-acetyltransferase [Spirochaetales bacterium]